MNFKKIQEFMEGVVSFSNDIIYRRFSFVYLLTLIVIYRYIGSKTGVPRKIVFATGLLSGSV